MTPRFWPPRWPRRAALGVVEHFEALLADSGYDSRLRQGVRRVFRGRWL